MAALVEPPQASTKVTALSKDDGVRRFFGVASSHTISTARLPVAVAIFAWWESAAGIDAEPGSARPSASAAEVMVDAVPIVMQWPGERAIPSSTSCQSAFVMLPARSSAQYFQVSLPLPRNWPRKSPRSIGPAGRKIAGRFIEKAPMRSAGGARSRAGSRRRTSGGCAAPRASCGAASRVSVGLLDAAGVDHLLPARELRREERRELRGRVGHDLEADVGEFPHDLGIAQRREERGLQLRARLARQSLRRDEGLPRIDREPGDARLGERRHVRERRIARLGSDREELRLAAAHVVR